MLGSGQGRFSPATWLIVLTIGTLVAVLVTPLGREINGAPAMAGIGADRFSAAGAGEVVAGPYCVSAYAVASARKGAELRTGLPAVDHGFWNGGGIGVVKEDFGTTVLIAAVVFVMILMAGCRWWHVGLLIPPAAVVIHHMLNTPFRRARLLAFMHPSGGGCGVA